MDDFGSTDPRKMPDHFFHESLEKDFSSAKRADTSLQNYTVCPRHGYLDVTFVCEDCQSNFTWTAQEQKFWFENLGHLVDSQETCCRRCNDRHRRIKQLRREYDKIITEARLWDFSKPKARAIEIVDALKRLGFQITGDMRWSRDEFRRSLYK